MFGRGNWAVFGIKQLTLSKFRKNLNSDVTMLEVSALAAGTKAKYKGEFSVGINPFGNPRKDEKVTGDSTLLQRFLSEPADVRDPLSDGEMAINQKGFGLAEEFELPDPDASAIAGNYYGFWVVMFNQKDVTDATSKKEQLSYDNVQKPFKFLNKDEKGGIEQAVLSSAVVERKQFPVLIDFNIERVYAQTTNEDEVQAVQAILAGLGAETFSLSWKFDDYAWTVKFLNAIQEETKFASEMRERAEELSRFRKEEVAKLDDKMMEGVVSTFYALSELPTGQWAGLTTPARIRFFDMDPVTCSHPSAAFLLLDEGELKPSVAASSVIFQRLDSKFNKKTDEEKQFRRDIFTLDINDNINLLDSGAALLRGFDLPQFKKEAKKAAKAQNDSLTVADYWKMWLSEMNDAVAFFVDNVQEVLQLNKVQSGLLPFAEGESKVTKETVEVE